MGYLDNKIVTVDAILTKKGRELLSKGRSEFNITQFALADDEVDYRLWNEAHPEGSDKYGIAIENMPVVEAFPDETLALKYKLLTLPRKTTRIPVITVSNSSIRLRSSGDSATITPTTFNFEKGNSTLGYTAILSDSEAAYLQVASGGELNSNIYPTTPRYIGPEEQSQTVYVSGFSFKVIAKEQPLEEKKATITIVGNETGGRVVIDLTVEKLNIATVNTSTAAN
jgi:hypothetical protein